MQTNKKGFTLVETIFYAAGLLILFLVMSAFLYYMYDWYQRATLAPRVDRIGVNLVDKLIKDIRSGTSISSGTFNTNNGAVTIAAKVSAAVVSKSFAISNGRLTYSENGGTAAYLTPSGLTVSKFYVTSTSTSISEGIKFDIDITFNSRAGTTTQSYSGFSMLRQSY